MVLAYAMVNEEVDMVVEEVANMEADKVVDMLSHVMMLPPPPVMVLAHVMKLPRVMVLA